MSRLERELAAAVDARIIADMRKRTDDQTTVRIPRETLAECAAAHRAALAKSGLVSPMTWDPWDPMHNLSVAFGRLGHYIRITRKG